VVNLACATRLHISVRVSAGMARRNRFALRSLVVHPGCTNTTSPALQILGPHRQNALDELASWPGAGRRTHTVVKHPFPNRVVQPVCTNAHARARHHSLSTDARKSGFLSLVACRRENVTAAARPTNQKKVHVWRCQLFVPIFSPNPILTISLRQATSIYSLYLRLRYSKPLALVKNLLAVYLPTYRAEGCASVTEAVRFSNSACGGKVRTGLEQASGSDALNHQPWFYL